MSISHTSPRIHAHCPVKAPDDYETRLRATNLFTASTEQFYDALHSLKTFPKPYSFDVLCDTIAVAHFTVFFELCIAYRN
jgi:hypothetical protein